MVKVSTSEVAEKVLSALANGEQLTANEINTRFGTSRAKDVIRNLRQNGYCVYGNQRANSKEVRYRLGTPSRDMIAALHGAIKAGLVKPADKSWVA